MSRTEAHAPSWVQARKNAKIHHDHARGECSVDPIEPTPRRGARHRRECAKYVEVFYTCTKDAPVTTSSVRRPVLVDGKWTRLYHRPEHKCWERKMLWEETEHGLHFNGWLSTQCQGHYRVDYHEDFPCACDNVPADGSCWVSYYDVDFGRSGRESDSLRRSRRDNRHESRHDLHEIRRAYNATGDTEVLDSLVAASKPSY